MSSERSILDAATSDAEAIELVVDASLALAFGGLGDLVWGHASVRDPGNRGLWMKAAGWGFEEIVPERVHLVSWEGEILEGSGDRHIEYLIHSSVYQARPDVQSVVHAHSDAVNAWCALDTSLIALTHAGTPFAEESRLPRFTETANLIRTPELGSKLTETLGESDVILIPHHGFVTTGPTMSAAVMWAVLLERACRTQLSAAAAGKIRSYIPPNEVPEFTWPPNQVRAGWRYLVRRGRSTFLT